MVVARDVQVGVAQVAIRVTGLGEVDEINFYFAGQHGLVLRLDLIGHCRVGRNHFRISWFMLHDLKGICDARGASWVDLGVLGWRFVPDAGLAGAGLGCNLSRFEPAEADQLAIDGYFVWESLESCAASAWLRPTVQRSRFCSSSCASCSGVSGGPNLSLI